MAKQVDNTPAGVLPLSMSEKKKKMKKQARAAPPLPAVRDVILWTLFHAGIVTVTYAFSIAYTAIITAITSQPLWWLLPRAPWRQQDADEVDMAGAFAAAFLWCGVCQAAVGALALVLPRLCRRFRLLRANAALVAACTVPGYSMWADGLQSIFVAADPGCSCFCFCFETGEITAAAAVFILGVGVLGLILRGGEEEE